MAEEERRTWRLVSNASSTTLYPSTSTPNLMFLTKGNTSTVSVFNKSDEGWKPQNLPIPEKLSLDLSSSQEDNTSPDPDEFAIKIDELRVNKHKSNVLDKEKEAISPIRPHSRKPLSKSKVRMSGTFFDHFQSKEVQMDLPEGFTLSEGAIGHVNYQLNNVNQIHTVLVCKKADSKDAYKQMVVLCNWLKKHSCRVIIDESIREEFPDLEILTKELREKIEFCVCIGGDGTMVHLSRLFQSYNPLPPVIGFARSRHFLGFLSPFSFNDYEKHLEKILDHNQELYICPRMRLLCHVYRHSPDLLNPSRTPSTTNGVCAFHAIEGEPEQSHQVLNEVAVGRGMSVYLTQIELWVDDMMVTRVQADGIIVHTPTGSTGLAMRAGCPVVAPSVPTICVTPKCPHSLSFRPLLLPDTSRVFLKIPLNVRGSCSVTFDGRKEIELRPGDSVLIHMSPYSLNAILMTEKNTEWYDSIYSRLLWNPETMINGQNNFDSEEVD